MNRHQINALAIQHITLEQDFDVILGCQDSCIRIIQGSNLAMEIPVCAPVSTLVPLREHTGRREVPASIAYGTDIGSFGVVDIDGDGAHNEWVVPDPNLKSPVTCIKMHDLMRDGTDALILGRNDGRVEVHMFNMDAMNTETSAPYKMFSKDVGTYCGSRTIPPHLQLSLMNTCHIPYLLLGGESE